MNEYKIPLNEKEMPTAWYNIQADLPYDLPPLLHPATLEPTILPPPLFPRALNEQEFSKVRFIDIPEEIQQIIKLWRPADLHRAYRLEKLLDTPAKIYYKYEGTSPVGSHKGNTAIAQAYYNKKEGIERLATETGAGQWGSALAMACKFFNMECKVYMVKVSYEQKPYRRILMEIFGAQVVASPSVDTNAGRQIRAALPNTTGSLGIAISEAVEDAATHDNTNYSLGSVLNHVLMHQTVIGLEAEKQLEKVGDYPDVVVGCVGGGSNFGGIAFPFLRHNLQGKTKTRFVAVEPAACPSLTKGPYAFDYGDTAKMAPVAKMFTLGHSFVPPGIHAGGLRYHGMSPLVSALYNSGHIEAVAYPQNAVFEAAMMFAQSEGIVCAPESAHAVRATIDEAMKCREAGETKTILFNLSGHGHFDLTSYQSYMAGGLEDYAYPEDMVREALAELPKVG